MSDIEDEEYNIEEQTYLDELQYNHDIAKKNYEKMIEDIEGLWENVMLPYLEDNKNYGNGFLEKFKKKPLLGQKLFHNFILENNIENNVLKDYIETGNKIKNYLKDKELKIKDTLYYSNKMYENLYSIKDMHIELLKLDNPKKWIDIFTEELEPLYDFF